jgi:hypothetical protein
MWPRSAENMGAPRAARRAIESSVSAIGTPSAMIGTTMATAVEDFWPVWMAVVERTKPRNIDPVSPMKIDAGLKL